MFTSAQQQAIDARGNALVVAGAGTGKTRTLVERCLRLLLEENLSLENILMVTFTEAAATEMRQRIRAALQTRSEREPANTRLAEQLALLDMAPISTLHGFCARLVREHFHELHIDPHCVVLDETQTGPLMQTTLSTLLERHYASAAAPSRAVQALIREQGHGSDEIIRALVMKLHRYSQTLPDPERWLTEQTAMFAEPEPTRWREWLLAGFNHWRKEALPQLADLDGKHPVIAEILAAVTALKEVPTSQEIGTALARIRAADAGEWPRGTKQKVRGPLKKFFADAEFLADLTASPQASDPLAEDWQWVRDHMLALVRLAREFTAEFSRAKRELGGLDFADLEQFSLRLLRDAAGRPTATARQWRDQFHHVLVDEYQDINAAQDAILAALSRDGADANRFLVGDVKQSIYRFRLANPKIFGSYEEAWQNNSTTGQRVPLADNFRSHEAILNFVNPLFAALLRPSIGGVGYSADAQLQFGDRAGRPALAVPPEGGEARVEFHLLAKVEAESEDTNGEGDAVNESPNLAADEREARVIARRLRELRASGHLIWDEPAKTFRPVEWRDMVVLLRAPGRRAESYAQEFHRAGVPLSAERGGFFDALEVMDLLNLLRLLDNPLQDVPLLAVLHSPLVGLSLDELALIRTHGDEDYFWTTLMRFGNENARRKSQGTAVSTENAADGTQRDPAKTVNEFADACARWRALLRHSALSHCLEVVLTETHYEALLLAGPRGPDRVANVRRLLDLARTYDPYQRQGLFRFLQFVAAQAESGIDHKPAPAPIENTVRLMSIHQSKGLEFPVVLVAGLGGRFNQRDLQAEILLDEEFGLCPKVTPPGRAARYPSLPLWLARRREKRELLGEEMRLLYVALTRARDTLLLVGTDTRRAAAEPWPEADATPLSDAQILGTRSVLDWLRLWLPQVTRNHDWRGDSEGSNPLLRWTIHRDTPEDAGSSISDDATEPVNFTASPEVIAQLRARMTWNYPFTPATLEPAKTSVSTLRRRGMERDEEARPWFDAAADLTVKSHRAAPEKLSAAAVGTAHHLFLQSIELARTGSILDLRNEGERLQRAGVLSAPELAALDFDALASFWQSELGGRIRAQAANVHRELPFTARLSPADLAELKLVPELISSADDDFVVVQGVADLAVILPAAIWLVDFKTDQFPARELADKTAAYTPQLQLYALALGRIYRRPVTERWLHFLSASRTVSV